MSHGSNMPSPMNPGAARYRNPAANGAASAMASSARMRICASEAPPPTFQVAHGRTLRQTVKSRSPAPRPDDGPGSPASSTRRIDLAVAAVTAHSRAAELAHVPAVQVF